MCQLTYVNFHDPFQNALMAYLLGITGSAEKHDDGCGMIFDKDKIWKTSLAAHLITNLGEILFEQASEEPLPFHIRQATYGIEVSKENAHPFKGKHYILMHNGTLLPRDGEEPKDKKKDSDSLRFLNSLDKVREKNPDSLFEDVFNETMSEFAGKFAFIIREKETGNDFIIRGRTAELWISELKVNEEITGYVINTSKSTMGDAFRRFINIAVMATGNQFELSEPKLLPVETIFIAKDKVIKEIGKASEYTPAPPVSKTKIQQLPSRVPSAKNGIIHSTIDDKELADIARLSTKIYEFLIEHSLSLFDLQIMFKLTGGISLLEVTREDLEMFVQFMIPKISSKKKLRAKIKELLSDHTFPHIIYDKYELDYPWMVEDENKVLNAVKEYTEKIPF